MNRRPPRPKTLPSDPRRTPVEDERTLLRELLKAGPRKPPKRAVPR